MAQSDDIRLTFHRVAVRRPMPVAFERSEVKAGFPSPAQDYLSDEIDLNDVLIHNREATFYVRINGDSMRDAAILDGDLAVVDREVEARDGDFVIAFVDGEPTIKQFRVEEDGHSGWLVAWNKDYPRIPVNGDNLLIWGVVTYVIHRVRGQR